MRPLFFSQDIDRPIVSGCQAEKSAKRVDDLALGLVDSQKRFQKLLRSLPPEAGVWGSVGLTFATKLCQSRKGEVLLFFKMLDSYVTSLI